MAETGPRISRLRRPGPRVTTGRGRASRCRGRVPAPRGRGDRGGRGRVRRPGDDLPLRPHPRRDREVNQHRDTALPRALPGPRAGVPARGGHPFHRRRPDPRRRDPAGGHSDDPHGAQLLPLAGAGARTPAGGAPAGARLRGRRRARLGPNTRGPLPRRCVPFAGPRAGGRDPRDLPRHRAGRARREGGGGRGRAADSILVVLLTAIVRSRHSTIRRIIYSSLSEKQPREHIERLSCLRRWSSRPKILRARCGR
jgi:hypothetical protein